MRVHTYSSLLFLLAQILPRETLVGSPVSCNNHGVACDISDLIEIFAGVESIDLCGDICLEQTNCMFYTYYGAGSFPLQNVCFTFTACESVDQCDGCVSEGRGCSRCRFKKVGHVMYRILDNGNGSVKDSPMRIEKLIFNCLEHLIPSERATMLKKILWKSGTRIGRTQISFKFVKTRMKYLFNFPKVFLLKRAVDFYVTINQLGTYNMQV